MNIGSFIDPIKSFFDFLSIPSLVLGVLLCAAWFIVRRAVKSGTYSFSTMLKDDNTGKESVLKLTTLASFAISTWYIMYALIVATKPDSSMLLIYLSVWASVPVGMNLTEALKTKWSVPTPTVTTTPTKE